MPPSIALATRGRLQGLRFQLTLLDREFDDNDDDDAPWPCLPSSLHRSWAPHHGFAGLHAWVAWPRSCCQVSS